MICSRICVAAIAGVISTASVALIVCTASAQVRSTDGYALLAQISDGYILATNAQDAGKYRSGGNYDPDVLEQLLNSQDSAVRSMIPVAQDLDAIRFKNDQEIVNGEIREKVPGSRARRPKRDFEPMVDRALIGLQLPFQGQEIRLAISNLRNAPQSSNPFDNASKGENMTQIYGIIETGLRTRLHNAFGKWANARSDGDGGISIDQEKSYRALPSITNTGSRTLHHCIIISRIEPDARKLAILGGAVQMVDERARIVFSDNTVDMAKVSANLAFLNSIQERGDLCYVPELAPGASIRLVASNTRLAQSIVVSIFSDETTAKGSLQLQTRSGGGRFGQPNGR